MKSNRRSVLIGLGALTVGGGAVFGTGAFSSVEAQRSVSVDTAGDSEALLGLDVTSDTLGGDGDTIEFDLDEEGVNLNGVTRFNGLQITNNSENDDVAVTIYEGEGTDGDEISVAHNADYDDENNIGLTFQPDEADALTEIEDDVTVDIVFNLIGEEDDSSIPDTITIEAEG